MWNALRRDTILASNPDLVGIASKFFESCRKATIRLFISLRARSVKRRVKQTSLKGLILAQNERWRRGLGMQVEREPDPSPHAPLPQGEGLGVRGLGKVAKGAVRHG